MMNNIFEDLIKFGRRTYYNKGHHLYYRGDLGDTFYIVEKGKVELYIYNANSEKIILSELQKGNFFGQIEVFTNGIRPHTAYVYPGTQLASIPAVFLKDYLKNNNQTAIELIGHLCMVIDQGIEKLEDVFVLSAYQKVSKKLYELRQQAQSNQVNISQKKISEFLALSERTTNLSLRRLKDKGAIHLRRSRIEILDDEILKNEFVKRENVA